MEHGIEQCCRKGVRLAETGRDPDRFGFVAISNGPLSRWRREPVGHGVGPAALKGFADRVPQPICVQALEEADDDKICEVLYPSAPAAIVGARVGVQLLCEAQSMR